MVVTVVIFNNHWETKVKYRNRRYRNYSRVKLDISISKQNKKCRKQNQSDSIGTKITIFF